jgi:hypothetical protein
LSGNHSQYNGLDTGKFKILVTGCFKVRSKESLLPQLNQEEKGKCLIKDKGIN